MKFEMDRPIKKSGARTPRGEGLAKKLQGLLLQVIRQGDEGSEFFVIVDGEAEVSVHGQGVVFTCAAELIAPQP